MKVILDGVEIEAKEGKSLLEAALEAGIFIPHICKHPDLEAVGGCRLCVVEIDGKVVPSCKVKVSEGLCASAKSDAAEKVRKMAMELILATHPPDCTGCPKFGNCELQSMYQYMGVSPEKWKMKIRAVPTDESNPLIKHLFTRCIRCGRCIRACRDLRGVKVLDFQKTKDGVRIGTDGGVSLEEAGCRFCGACVEVCPTGSILDALKFDTSKMSYADTVVPCRAGCPSGIEIPRYIRAIKEGDFSKAAAIARERVPFPEILGSICTHPCEKVCKRSDLGSPMSICKLKRAAGANDDREWKKRVRTTPSTGKKVGIIGAGPAGLTTAYYLAKKGHDVSVFESNEKAGGQCRYGIPAYRLPDELIDKEIQDIVEEGVKIFTGVSDKTPQKLLDEGFDGVMLATGTHSGVKLRLGGADLPGVYINTDFLKRARKHEEIAIGDTVMVLGGGNVAYDCARTAKRLGARTVYIACLEEREKMTATEDEIEEGREEGIILFSATSFLQITGTDKVEGVELQDVEKFYFDENRRAVTQLKEGTKRVVPVETVIFAVGQRPEGTENFGVELTHGPYIQVDAENKTSLDGVWAAGDVATGTKSVIEAIAGGRRCAEQMDKYLCGDGDISETLTDRVTPNPFIGRIEDFAREERVSPIMLDPETRSVSFAVAENAFTCEEAMCEAGRCLQCDLRLDITRPKLWMEY